MNDARRLALLSFAAWLTACGGSVDGGAPAADAGVEVGAAIDGGVDVAPSFETAAPPDTAPALTDTSTIEDSSEVSVAPACDPSTFTGVALLDEVTSNSIRVRWSVPAGCADLRFEIYFAIAPASVDFAKVPTFVATVGASSYLVTGLEPSTTYSFGVRARDTKGDADANTKVLSAKTLAPSFRLEIQPIFDRSCALVGCHVLPTPAQGLPLSSGFSYSSTVGVESVERPPSK
ncbi:MAG: fibronectin type III domain-containing protein, partial [Polyangiales bacterium]